MKTKFHPDKIDKINSQSHRKELIRIIGEMKNPAFPEGQSPETAVPFYVKELHTFACKAEHPLIIIATKEQGWKKVAKAAFKQDKKKMLFGNCYLSEGALCIVKEGTLGDLKIERLKKAAKGLLKKVGIKTIQIVQGKKADQVKETAAPAPATEKTAVESAKPKAPQQAKASLAMRSLHEAFNKGFEATNQAVEKAGIALSQKEKATLKKTFKLGGRLLKAYAKAPKTLQEELASAIPGLRRRMRALKNHWTKIKDASTNQSEGKTTAVDDALKQELKGLDGSAEDLLKRFKKR